MIESLKKDRVAQGLLVVVILMICGMCGVFGFFGYTFITRPKAETSINRPAASPPTAAAIHLTPTIPPTKAPSMVVPDSARRSYTVLLFLQAGQVLLEETASQVETGKINGFKALGQLIVVGAFVKGVDDALQKSPPDANFQTAWEQARPVVPLVQQVIKRWNDHEINAADVSGELAPARAATETMLATADKVMTDKYGVDQAQLNQIRTTAMTDFRESLAKDNQKKDDGEVIKDVVILSSSDYTDYDMRHIVGEVQNNSPQPVQVRVIATYYGGTGEVAGTETADTELDILLPAQKSPFKIVSDINPQATRYELQLEIKLSDPPETKLQILSANDRIDESNHWRIAGEIANQGNASAKFVKIVATIYGDQGVVLDTDFTYSSLDSIPAGGKSPFELDITRRDGFVRYELQVQGR